MATAKYPAASVTLADLFGELPGIPNSTAILSGAHDAVVTTFTLTATVPATWPTAGAFSVDNEIVQYTGKSGATLTGCTRGQQDTTAAAHSDGATVRLGLTKGTINQLIQEVIAIQTRLGLEPYVSNAGTHRFRYEPLNTAGINVVNVGSGGTTAYASGRGQQMSTGATNPSSTSQRIVITPSGTVLSRIQRVRRVELQAYIADVLASANSYLYITTESNDQAPSGTARHFGIKNLNGTVSFTTADGTTEQTTAITSFVTAAQIHAFVITFDGTTAKLYIDQTLRATHATNVPTADTTSATFRAFIDNNASVNARTMAFLSCDVIFASA